MKTIVVLASILLGASAQGEIEPGKTSEVTPVKFVNLELYQGTWYEIAALPQPFETGCSCVQAQYALNASGHVDVINSCRRQNQWINVEGVATVINPETNAELEVEFKPNPPGAYIVVGLDAEYRYAVVASPRGPFPGLWILSRSRVLDPKLLGEAMEIAARQGLPLAGFRFMSQEGCETAKN